jgi:hypothetical protein
VILLSACAGSGRLLYLTLLLQLSGLGVAGLLVGLLLLEHRLGDSDVILGGDAGNVSWVAMNWEWYTHDERAIVLVVSRLVVVGSWRRKVR